MNLGHQLVTELSTMNMDYTDLNSLALQLPKRQLALGKTIQEQRLVWEMLCVLDEAQHRKRDQDMACALRQMHDSALADFCNNPHDGCAAICQRMTQEVTDQVAVCTTQQQHNGAVQKAGMAGRGDQAQPARVKATLGGGSQHKAESTGQHADRAGSKAAAFDLCSRTPHLGW